MRTSLTGIFALIIGTTGIYGVLSAQERGDDRTARFFGYMDRNRDGRLDPDELRRMPGSFRDSLQRTGVSLDRGISRDEFLRVIPRAMEEMRRARERDDDDDDRRRDEERRREEARRRDEENRRNSSQNRPDERRRESTVYRPRRIEPVTIPIPSQFSEGDVDQDGQLGYYEWRKWKPEARQEFHLRDRNGDGFLTPQELQLPLPEPDEAAVDAVASAGPGASTTSGPGQVSGRTGPSGRFGDRSRGPGSGRDRGSRGGEPRSTAAASSNAPPDSESESDAPPDRRINTARFLFGTLDKDKDQVLSPDEISTSRSVKPKFEAAGIDLSKPMSQEEFTDAYLKAFAN